MSVTQNIADYIKERGIPLMEISRRTEIPYSIIYSCFAENYRNRDLRADELLKICKTLKVNPMDFMDK